ncbi:uncharacterized protein LOC126721962 [Quercus robur]|uniref:uncharacterized protein LOC126721962 n=1 Tax=Quercus robur TaxID=38942 RepID=UPI002161D788|nr:uncharacterized protein LOC126721962 [Quercus robur]
MRPLYNSFPQQPNSSTAPPSQQVMPPTHSNTNSSNSVQKNTTKFRPQFGMNNNPQVQVPFNNSNMRPSINRPGFMNPPLQNSHLGMPHLGSQPSQSHVGFSAQNNVSNMNPVQGFPVNGQFCNMAQNPNQVNVSQPAFVHNMQSSNQQLNQNMGFPNGQFCMPNMLQNMNQFMPTLQMPNSSQVVSYGIPFCPPYMGVPNQAPRATVPQNPTFFANSQFGLGHCNQVRQQVNQNQQNLVPPTANANALKPSPFAAQQLQGGNLPALPNHCSVQPQGNLVNNGGIDNPSSNRQDSPNKNYTMNPKGGQLRGGFQKSQFHRMKNAKRGFPNEHKGKGFSKEKAGKFGLNSNNQARGQKRSLSLTYTEQEIQQWCEARRKNYPSKATVEKKQGQKLADAEGIAREAKLRREQLKEILAKQAELGVEVAEVPLHYLSESEKQGQRREENRMPFTKKGRFRNRFDKRGRYEKKDRFAKKQKLADKDSSDAPSLNKKKPTLLQKLLSADVRRDKSHLLQIFRFMVMNSFFTDWPDKPLKFPSVIVKESGCESEVVEEKSSPVGKDAEGGNKAVVNKSHDEDDDEDDNGVDEDKNEGDDNNELSYFARIEGIIGERTEIPEEEEGEIVDYNDTLPL